MDNGITKFIVFSDDIEHCKNHICTAENIVFPSMFTYADGGDELKDFETMLRCEHAIIANSSFSLIASILNKNKDKIVISPHEDNWFGPANKKLDPKDMIPKNYFKIKYR